MLAQNFKTPADLRITDAEFEALSKTLGMLERGELTHATPENYEVWSATEFPKFFNMGMYRNLADCGSVCCIAGTAEIVGNFPIEHFFWASRDNEQLKETFGYAMIGALRPITVQQAAIALRNYLTHGEPRWHEALA